MSHMCPCSQPFFAPVRQVYANASSKVVAEEYSLMLMTIDCELESIGFACILLLVGM